MRLQTVFSASKPYSIRLSEPYCVSPLAYAVPKARRAIRAADRQFYTSSSALALLVSYFYLKRNETRHLFGLAQMLRYERSPVEVVEYLGLD